MNEVINIEQKIALHKRLTYENIERVQICAWIIIILESLMLGRYIYKYGFVINYYIVLYFSLLFISALLLLLIKITNDFFSIEKSTYLNNHLMLGYYSFLLYWGVIITLIDQTTTYGHVTAYLTNVMIVSFLFVTTRKSYFVLHFIPFIILVIGFLLLQENSNIIEGHIINISVFLIFSAVGARYMYRNYLLKFIQELELSEKNIKLASLNKYFEQLSAIDDLTQLPNRRGLYDYVNNLVAYNKQLVSVLVLDVDAFKAYNDYYGHIKGNEILVEISQVISTEAKSLNQFAARFGGEEFVIVTNNLTHKEVEQLAELIRKEVEELSIIHEASPVSKVVTISIGYASGVIENEESFEYLMNNADCALYEGKRKCRNVIISYNALQKEKEHVQK